MPKTSKIDGDIIDLILEHYNKQSMSDEKEILTGEDFMRLVRIAEYFHKKREQLQARVDEKKAMEKLDKDVVGLA